MPARASPNAGKAIQKDRLLRETHERITKTSNRQLEKMAIQLNKRRKMAPQLKERDKVYLSTKNLRIKRPKTKKLDHAEVGPFWVQKQT